MVDFLMDIRGRLFSGIASVEQSKGIFRFECVWEIYSARYSATYILKIEQIAQYSCVVCLECKSMPVPKVCYCIQSSLTSYDVLVIHGMILIALQDTVLHLIHSLNYMIPLRPCLQLGA